MKVVHISFSDTGGAANALVRLHEGLLNYGIDSHILVLYKEKPEVNNSWQYANTTTSVFKKGYNYIIYKYIDYQLKELNKSQTEDYGFFTLSCSSYEVHRHPLLEEADIINLHWVSNFVDIKSFLRRHTKVVWSLHDMNPFTGGCHYAWSCVKFQHRCHSCQQINEKYQGEHDQSSINYKLKKKALQDAEVVFVANSYWLEGEARKSSMINVKKHKLTTIHCGLDDSRYYPKSKSLSKNLFNIPSEAFTLCVSASSLKFKIKGLDIFIEALKKIDLFTELYCIVIGEGRLDMGADSRIHFVNLGYVADLETQISAYSAADAFVIPSLQEAFGQTALEAMACGTPVIGSEVGGIPDMVEEGKTGLLFKPGNPVDLAEKIKWMIVNVEKCKQMGLAAREIVEKSFSSTVQAGKYIDIYINLLQSEIC